MTYTRQSVAGYVVAANDNALSENGFFRGRRALASNGGFLGKPATNVVQRWRRRRRSGGQTRHAYIYTRTNERRQSRSKRRTSLIINRTHAFIVNAETYTGTRPCRTSGAYDKRVRDYGTNEPDCVYRCTARTR